MPGTLKSRRARRIGARGTVTAAFTPSSITGLVGWWKADAGTSTTTDGVAISSWADQSASGATLAQATVASRPVYKTAIQNGRPVVRFDGINDFLSASVAVAPKTVIVVAKYAAAAFTELNGLVTDTTTSLILVGGGGTATVFFDPSGIGAPDAAYWFNGATRALNNATGPMNAFAVCSITSAMWGSVTTQLGQDRGNTTRIWNGDIGEVLMYDTVLSAANRQAVESYLKTRWGTP